MGCVVMLTYIINIGPVWLIQLLPHRLPSRLHYRHIPPHTAQQAASANSCWLDSSCSPNVPLSGKWNANQGDKREGTAVGNAANFDETFMVVSCVWVLFSSSSGDCVAGWWLLGQQNQTNTECWFTIDLVPSLPRWHLVCLTDVIQRMEAKWGLLQFSCLINSTHPCTLVLPSATLNPFEALRHVQ